ncbi:MAG: LacI family transcriptional regulator [Acidobacteria bacterium]|nr:MAG: LacI family transcriptional regulator [Acidobacteriota bacterium]
MRTSDRKRYLVKSIVHASQVLGAFESSGETVRLRDVVSRTGFSTSMCFRLLYTLHECGFVDKVGENLYRLATEFRRRPQYRIGYASQGQPTSFPREVLAGLKSAAEREQVELLVLDNRYQPRVALRNADQFIREDVDLVIEFQTDESVAPVIASKYLQAGIPLIAVDIPHPGATYFGANNYEAGLIGGQHLGRFAARMWNGTVDEILMIQLLRAGPIPQARVRGMLEGIHRTLRLPETCATVLIDGDGQFQTALVRARKHLRESRAHHVLVGAANDPSALGALRAFEEAGRKNDCAVVGHNAEPEARAEMRNAHTRLIGSVAFFPEKYGEGLIRLALGILSGKTMPPAVLIKHRLVTPENVDHFYPNDSLLDAR